MIDYYVGSSLAALLLIFSVGITKKVYEKPPYRQDTYIVSHFTGKQCEHLTDNKYQCGDSLVIIPKVAK